MVSLVVVYVQDLEACVDFYGGLGLEFARERHGGGPVHYAAVLPGGGVFELYPATEEKRTGAVRLGFVLGDGEGRRVLRDPEGRIVEVCGGTA
ncbi:VOC family protein [Actinomadura sp. 21ATH]|uniref:VOC family protein n=1 Tax=Actinomadura sp. 21ATH TaxID=1735444 RepID=UPI0035BFBD97